ncbi:hypothetical protein BC940DRAFT_312997 [Gongronella butleri]|nr:hypothetical protein BC940DRAFT_312997 [Gongronella butleri]
MAGRRQAAASTSDDDPAEFLDEQEQEQLLKELRDANDKSNLLIQIGLLFVGVLVCAIFLVFLYDIQTHERRHQPLYLPFPFFSEPMEARFPFPGIGVLFSLVAIVLAMLTTVTTCRIAVQDIVSLTSAHRGIGALHRESALAAAGAATLMPLACLLVQGCTLAEVGLWGLPWMVLIMHMMAIRMMRQVQESFTMLEKSQYKYKGA